jgi:hypothetical protein
MNIRYTLTSIYNLATTYWDVSRRAEAIELYQQELEICRRLYGAQHQGTLMSIANLVKCYHDVGRVEDAVNATVAGENYSRKG